MAEKPAQIPTTGRGGLRVDAAQNRARILDAARDAFAERGLDVPMAAIARRAEVGIATLFRRFPTKEALVVEVFADQLEQCESLVDTALADPDPWRGFCSVIETVCEMQVQDRGFTEAFLTAYPDAIDHEARRERAERQFAELVHRAQIGGGLRTDFAPSDLALVLRANAGAIAAPASVAPRLSRRLVAYLLRAFEAHPPAAVRGPLPAVPHLGLGDVMHTEP